VGPRSAALARAYSDQGRAQEASGLQPAWRACGEIHVQAKREDHGDQDASHREGDDNPGWSPAARRATPGAQRACGRATKYPGKGVLHDLPRRDAGLRRT
jgi:hypothetical protein